MPKPHGAKGFRAKIAVLRPEGVYTYVERAKTTITKNLNRNGENRRFSTLAFLKLIKYG